VYVLVGVFAGACEATEIHNEVRTKIMATTERPLSPHLQIYRPQLTSMLSIAHRGTGVFLTLGTPLLVYWLWSVGAGGADYAAAQGFFGSFIGRLVMFAWSYALFYHLCNGIRHLYWDVGGGFDIETVYRTGYTVLLASAVLTVVAWVAAYATRGGA
jgi:succinate dehydrogenase / fumarate reductase cytochrome b subunit